MDTTENTLETKLAHLEDEAKSFIKRLVQKFKDEFGIDEDEADKVASDAADEHLAETADTQCKPVETPAPEAQPQTTNSGGDPLIPAV